jgi:RimJ/RimL family protein N-acetyltransferase
MSIDRQEPPLTRYLHDDQIPREIDAETGLAIGPKLANPGPARRPARIVLDGRYCRLEPIDAARHGDDLYRASTPPDAAKRFRYLFDEPFTSRAVFDAWLAKAVASEDPMVFAVIDKRTGKCEGRQTLMRITPEHRCIETGSIYWGPAISRSQVSTEANFLFAKYVFDDLGFRRFEWKCDALNAPSRAAALRFGFTYEGHFRRATITRGRSRDTAWFAMIDEEWPALKAAYERWLDPANFDAEGRQKQRLAVLTAAALGSSP